MLTRWLLRLLFMPTLLFVATISLIRAQPYDDAEMREFLLPPEGCDVPCWQGIRPGVTTVDEALGILNSLEWFGEIHDKSLGENVIYAYWNEPRPSFAFDSGIATDISDTEDIVININIHLNAPVARVRLALGTPQQQQLPSTNDGSFIRYTGVYLQGYSLITSQVSCPLRIERLYLIRSPSFSKIVAFQRNNTCDLYTTMQVSSTMIPVTPAN